MNVKMVNVYNYHSIQVDDILVGIHSKILLINLLKNLEFKFRFDKAMIAFLDCVNQV